jgi:hypothetical protein
MAVVTAAVCLLSTSAWAGPATANSLQIGLGFRYGIEMNDGDFNPWGPGIGASVGYTLPIIPIYVGGNFDYFFGGSVEAGGFKTSGHVWQLMAEGGYDVGLTDLMVIRPKLGLGPASMSTEVCAMSCSSDSVTKFAVAPGAAFMLFTPVIKLALDLRYDIILADPTAKALLFSVGVGF